MFLFVAPLIDSEHASFGTALPQLIQAGASVSAVLETCVLLSMSFSIGRPLAPYPHARKAPMRNLLDGFMRFKTDVFPRDRKLFSELACGQKPEALFITCADSRIVPDVITQSRP